MPYTSRLSHFHLLELGTLAPLRILICLYWLAVPESLATCFGSLSWKTWRGELPSSASAARVSGCPEMMTAGGLQGAIACRSSLQPSSSSLHPQGEEHWVELENTSYKYRLKRESRCMPVMVSLDPRTWVISAKARRLCMDSAFHVPCQHARPIVPITILSPTHPYFQILPSYQPIVRQTHPPPSQFGMCSSYTSYISQRQACHHGSQYPDTGISGGSVRLYAVDCPPALQVCADPRNKHGHGCP